jgi:RHH-type proline utilization regulon transcriptional repressor/proline dehydrogenase/delta 1-pyrroline-5-carboxylate dehydrogenase
MVFKLFEAKQMKNGSVGLREKIFQTHHIDELSYVTHTLTGFNWSPELSDKTNELSSRLVQAMRTHQKDISFLTDFFSHYGLSSQEGLVLMCLSEALLRIPDVLTANLLIKDKLEQLNPKESLAKSGSFIMKSSTLALRFVKHFLSFDPKFRLKNQDIQDVSVGFWNIFGKAIVRLGEGSVRAALSQAIRMLGNQFIFAEDIGKALEADEGWRQHNYLFSYDILGESARTHEDAERYAKGYLDAIQAIARHQEVVKDPTLSPGLSVKLSAMAPFYGEAHKDQCIAYILPKMKEICQIAANAGLMITVDAEEAKTLDVTLDILEILVQDPELANWNGLGIAVQAYQKRAMAVIDWIVDLAQRNHRKIPVRLVKGAYWDIEIKRSQSEGHEDYPVFTKKSFVDLHYLSCAQKLLQQSEWVYPQFATHNAVTIAAVQTMAMGRQNFEFQKLFGMGDELYIEAARGNFIQAPCRIYAPVGLHKELLPYLIRRMLENGSNTSFLSMAFDTDVPPEILTKDPVRKAQEILLRPQESQKRIAKPIDLFVGERQNSKGIDLSNRKVVAQLVDDIASYMPRAKAITSLVHGQKAAQGEERSLYSPIRKDLRLGSVIDAPSHVAEQAMRVAREGFLKWTNMPVQKRASTLEKAADMLEKNQAKFLSILIHEAGKTIEDAIAEVREAVDFCRYYAAHGRQLFGEAFDLKGPTGEKNSHYLVGRGVFVAISPWNFPLAIFLGQVAAALMAGNTVVAKSAAQTPIIAFEVVRLLHDSGVPTDALQLILGKGSVVGKPLLEHPSVAGVVFTGSNETVRLIQSTLSKRDGPLVPLIAETGGINAMIIDSSALLEQTVDDVVTSAFRSAGQRCSCLRLVYVQEDIADDFCQMLKGAMGALNMGNPSLLKTDVGPVIDEKALSELQAYTDSLSQQATLIGKTPLPSDLPHGYYIQPQAYEVERAKMVDKEVFGPILHVVRFEARNLDKVVDSINSKGFGLTLGIQSRIDTTIDYITKRARVGNIYVNRNIIGAMVGVQPFGGEGLSGTGPKAGGIYYLIRFATERVLSVNTVAMGGNIDLLTSDDDW